MKRDPSDFDVADIYALFPGICASRAVRAGAFPRPAYVADGRAYWIAAQVNEMVAQRERIEAAAKLNPEITAFLNDLNWEEPT